ncbi:PRD domain-containing protein [Bacillus sonorensis]|uniref:PRD domain-containing protein n=1 Tax=Bacillus sonorensis TaxID=119858 RepID=UPI003D2283E3
MNRRQVEENLEILTAGHAVTKNVVSATLNTFDFLAGKLKKQVIEDSDMFWTHMSMALARLERGECEDEPPNDIINEVYETPYQNMIEEVIDYIDSQAVQELPEGERAYFYLHLHRVIECNQ